jgi:hypothetical protein
MTQVSFHLVDSSFPFPKILHRNLSPATPDVAHKKGWLSFGSQPGQAYFLKALM